MTIDSTQDRATGEQPPFHSVLRAWFLPTGVPPLIDVPCLGVEGNPGTFIAQTKGGGFGSCQLDQLPSDALPLLPISAQRSDLAAAWEAGYRAACDYNAQREEDRRVFQRHGITGTHIPDPPHNPHRPNDDWDF